MRRVKAIIIAFALILAMTACDTTAEVSSENLSSQGEQSQELVSEEESAGVGEELNLTSEEIQNSENVSEEDSEAETSEEESASENDSTSEEESISEESEPEFSVEEYNANLFVKKAVNVRIGPSTDYEKIGGLNKGEQIQVTGIADTGWYQIEYNGSKAYVSSNYLVDEATYQAILAEEEAAALAAQQAASEQAAAEQQATEQTNTGGYKEQVVALMNQERSAVGVGGITQNATLDNLAQIRAQEIVSNFSHTRPNGTSCFTVFEENGVTYMAAGENIAAGYGTPEEVMVGWMNSEGHRANILNGNYTQVGIGYYTDPNSTYGTYWVQIFSN